MDAQKPKRPLTIIKASQAQQTDSAPKIKEISTARDKFRASIPPFLLSVYVSTNSGQQYIVSEENRYVPSHPENDPLRVYTWLDATLGEIFSHVLDMVLIKDEINTEDIPTKAHQNKIIPAHWISAKLSTVYVLNSTCKHLDLVTFTNGTVSDQLNKTLYELIEIGDAMQIIFTIPTPPPTEQDYTDSLVQ